MAILEYYPLLLYNQQLIRELKYLIMCTKYSVSDYNYLLAAQLYVMNFWKLPTLWRWLIYGGICIFVEMLLFAWTLKFESPCQNLTVMINLNVFLANGWNLKLILFYFLLCFFFCLFIALAHDQAQKITFRESRKMSPIIQENQG